MSQEVYIAVDTAELEGRQLGAVKWLSFEGDYKFNWFGGSVLFSADSGGKNDPTASVSFRFSGIAFALYGNDASFNDFQFSVDNKSPEPVSLTSLGVQTYQRLYQSASFSEGTHTVALSGIHGLALDYATFLPGPTTPLRNKRVTIDDANDAISYRGSGWIAMSTESAGFWISPNLPYQLFQGGAHRTSRVGDTMVIRYTGDNLKVFGILARSGGRYTLSYSMDGGPEQERKVEYPSASPVDHVHALIVEIPTSPSSEHTVTITLTGVDGGLPLVVDYVTYNAGFDDLRSMPVLGHAPGPPNETSKTMSNSALPTDKTPSSPIPTGKTSTSPIPTDKTPNSPVPTDKTSSSPIPTDTMPSDSIPTDAIGNTVESGRPSHPHRVLPVGAIVGGAIGLLVVVILAGLFLVARRKGQKPALVEPYDTSPIPPGETTVDALTGVHASTQRTWHGAAMHHLPNKYRRSLPAMTMHHDPPPAYDRPNGVLF